MTAGRLTGLPGGGVDGGQEGAGAGRVEGADRQEVLRAALQPAHRHRGLVAGDPDLAHGLWFGVVLPVDHLLLCGRRGARGGKTITPRQNGSISVGLKG